MATDPILETGRPSASTVLQKLVADSEAERQRQAGPLVAVPPPTLLSRLLVVTCIALVLFTTWCVLSLVGQAKLLVDGIRSRHLAEQFALRALPAGEDLMSTQVLAEALHQHPFQASVLHQRRGLAFARTGQSDEAIAAFQEASLTTQAELAPGVQMAWAECLADHGQWDAVRDRLLSSDRRHWSEADRQRAVRLLTGAWERTPGAPAREPAGTARRTAAAQTDGRPDS